MEPGASCLSGLGSPSREGCGLRGAAQGYLWDREGGAGLSGFTSSRAPFFQGTELPWVAFWGLRG